MLISLVLISACRKSDNATMPDGIVYLNQPQIDKVAGTDPAILDTDPLGFNAKLNVGLYFKDSDVKPEYLDLVVIKNGDKTNVKTIKANINSYPTEVELTGQMLIDLFGETIVSGDFFDIGADYIKGQKYLVFPEVGEGYGAGVASQPGASPTTRYTAICGFEADDFLGDGNFEVKTDGWADFGVGAVATVSKVDETTLAIEYPIAGFNPILLKINSADNTLTVDRQQLGDYGAGWQYGIVSTLSVAGNDNFVNPCNGQISVRLSYVVSAGGFGNFILLLEKN